MFTQAEADALLAVEKQRVDDTIHEFPGPGTEIVIPLTSTDEREQFMLDIRRHRIDLIGVKYQTRARATWPLARLDLGRPHTNPDGTRVSSAHLHLYREGFGMKWAQELDRSHFPDPSDAWELLNQFMRFCNITREPIIHRDLWI